MNQSGSAKIYCVVTASGTLSECTVASESPADFGFGDAALKMSKLFKMKPQTQDGQPVGGAHINIPIRFQVPSE
jgi:protein TonB